MPGVVVVVDEVAGGVIVGTVGASWVPREPKRGDTLIVGTGAAELTPRLPISVDPNGIPVRAAPPGVVGVVEVGVDDEARLAEPEPHIPDNPEVASIPEVVDSPDVDGTADDVDVPDLDASAVAAVAGIDVPADVPPPS